MSELSETGRGQSPALSPGRSGQGRYKMTGKHSLICNGFVR